MGVPVAGGQPPGASRGFGMVTEPHGHHSTRPPAPAMHDQSDVPEANPPLLSPPVSHHRSPSPPPLRAPVLVQAGSPEGAWRVPGWPGIAVP